MEYSSFSFGETERTSLDFFELRKIGLDYIQQLSGKEWTDFNSHDPGVTMLEQICYALTDVSLRSSYSINDLLASSNKGRIDARKNGYFQPSEIYRTHPVTESDTKKVLLDEFTDIQNLWITYTDNGGLAERMVLTKKIQILPKTIFHKNILGDDLNHAITNFVAENRNLGEDVDQIIVLKPKPLIIELEIHLQSQENLHLVMSSFLLDLFEFVYKPVKRYNFEEISSEEDAFTIFSGPKLKNGFIKEGDFEKPLRKLKKAQIEQILTERQTIYMCKVSNLSVSGPEVSVNEDAVELLGDYYFDLLNGNVRSQRSYHAFDVIFENITLKIHNKERHLSVDDRHNICHLFHESWTKKYRPYAVEEVNDYKFNSQLLGNEFDMENYHSIQHHFPLVYGIGVEGLPSSEPVERHAKANQLKAFLLFFERFLADEQTQIANLSNFFDIAFADDKKQTYYSQYPSSVPLIEKVYPKTLFEVDASVYNKAVWRGGTPKGVKVKRKALREKSEKNQLELLRDWVCDTDYFKEYLRKTINRPFPAELEQRDPEIQGCLEMLFALNFPWLSKKTNVNFGISVVLSFAMLLRIEQKEFTISSFAESFIKHLKRMLQVELKPIEKGIRPERDQVEQFTTKLFGELGEVNCTNPIHQKYLNNFLFWVQPYISKRTEQGFFERKNRIYDHMLARFGEDLSMEPFLDLSNQKSNSDEVDVKSSSNSLQHILTDQLLNTKANYLNDIVDLSANRIKGESFVMQEEGKRSMEHISGLEHTILAKTGIAPRVLAGAGKKGKKRDVEELYVVDHILLRDFLRVKDLEYGFKFVDANNNIICETTKGSSWAKTEQEREKNLDELFETIQEARNLFDYGDDGNEMLISPDIKSSDGDKILASFHEGYTEKEAVLELIRLCNDQDHANRKTRLRELERIRAKGIHKVTRGYYGQRRLIYQLRSRSMMNTGIVKGPVGEDFFNLSVSVILPQSRGKFKSDQFRSYIKSLIVERTPSHIHLRVHFLDSSQMVKFRKKYEAWEKIKMRSYGKEEVFTGLKKAASEVYSLLLEIQKKEKITDALKRANEELERAVIEGITKEHKKALKQRIQKLKNEEKQMKANF